MDVLKNILEIAGVVLLRFEWVPRIWAILLIAINSCSLIFIRTAYGQLNLAAVLAAIVVMAMIYARRGFVRLLGVGHIFWIPMLIAFATHLPDRADQPALYTWVVTLIAMNSISLVIDAIDVTRYACGERLPHYCWDSDEPNAARWTSRQF